jgi:FkbM family methyltransferase
VIEFNRLEGWVRRHFTTYVFLRRLAPIFCKFINLEEGFDFLRFVRIMSPDLVVVDVGANDGTSIRMIRRYLKGVRIIAIDPVQRPRFQMHQIEFHDIALDEEEGEKILYTPALKSQKLTQYSSFFKDKLLEAVQHDTNFASDQISIEEKVVKTRTLDSLEIQPLFIKIDVEGAEMSVLRGSSLTLEEFHPIVLIEILSVEIYREISAFLRELGYINLRPGFKKDEQKAFYENCDFLPTIRNYLWLHPDGSSKWELEQ